MAVARSMPATAITRPARPHQPAQPLAAVSAISAKFRRCTFRRIEMTHSVRALPVYEVNCMYPDRETPLLLGELVAAHPVCAACTNQGIFRADAD